MIKDPVMSAVKHEKATLSWALNTAMMLHVAFAVPGICRAELVLNSAVEYLSWKEATTPQVKETGPLFALGISYIANRESGALFAYRGKLWGGTVNYDGSTLFGNTPRGGRTGYAGLGNELQARWRRSNSPDSKVDIVLGAGVDAWRRSLSAVQNEDFAIGYLRLGVESSTDNSKRWSVSMGLKYPVWTYEDAHLDDIGFDSNPTLQPGKEISPFGSLGYRLAHNLRLIGYYDGFRFSRSAPVQTNEVAMGLGPVALVQPATTMSVFGLKLEYRLR